MFVSPEVSKAFYVIKHRLQFFYIKVMAYDGTELIPSQLPFIYVLVLRNTLMVKNSTSIVGKLIL